MPTVNKLSHIGGLPWQAWPLGQQATLRPPQLPAAHIKAQLGEAPVFTHRQATRYGVGRLSKQIGNENGFGKKELTWERDL